MAFSSSMPADDADPDLDPTDEFLDGDPITVEEQARAMGWKPLEEYNGDPRRWTDAEAFVKKGLEELPVLRDQNHRLSTKLTRMGAEIGKLRNTASEQALAVQDALRMARTANQAGYDRALRELNAQRRAAAETGDLVAFDDVEKQIEAMESERAKVVGPEPAAAAAPAPAAAAAHPGTQGAGLDPAVTEFTRDPENRWFFDAKRPHLKQSMIALHGAVLNEGEILDVAEQLQEAKTRLIEMYPEDFAGRRAAARQEPDDEIDDDDSPPERRPAPAARRPVVNSPSRAPITPGGRRGRSPFDEITDPAERTEAKKAYERMKSMDAGLTESEYMVLYSNPHADALELRAKRRKS